MKTKNDEKGNSSNRRLNAMVRRFQRPFPKTELSPGKEDILNKRIEESKNSKSFKWETDNDWKDFVVEPIIKHMLAPREARAALELFGNLGDIGVSIPSVLEVIKHLYYVSA